jgi:NAD(P)-dependent dehydrogenase (short-subunit alcohol dehydrogenase family)
LESVRAGAKQFLALGQPIDIFIANAGLARAGGLTKQGFEMTFGVNHLGHFLLLELLRPALERAAPARVVIVASRGHERLSKPFPFERLKKPASSLTGFPEYQYSKLCNVLHAKEAARRWGADKVHFYSLHPGVIASDIWRTLPWPLRPLVTRTMRTVEQGCVASVHCAISPDVASHTGRYYGEDGAERRCNPLADDLELARSVWEQSEAWVKPYM